MLVRGCEKFLPALAELFCLALPGSCLARHTNLYLRLCTLTFIPRNTCVDGSMKHIIHLQFGLVLMALILVLVIVFVQVYPY